MTHGLTTQLTAAETARRLRAREISAVEVAQAYLERIDRVEPELRAFLTLHPERTVSEAETAQRLLDAGEGGPLTGVPVAIKDNVSTAGVETTCASRILKGYVPPYDATVVERLRAAGLVSLGKTNLDEFAMGTSGENSAFQTTRNPWNPSLVPGGSSSGSAAAVAGELAPISIGSDTGGSIRMPAALCGIVGFKPTYGRVSRYGLVAFGSSLDQIGPFGRTVEDVALLAEAISGHDPRDSTSLPRPPISTGALKEGSVKGLKLGVPRQLLGEAVERGVREAFDAALDVLRREGATIDEVDLPAISVGVTTYYIIAPAEASSNLARFDGIRYGGQAEGDGHAGVVAATRGRLFGHEVKLRIMIGTYALSAGYYDAYYNRAQQVRGLMAAEFDAAFREHDVIVSPASPIVAFPVGAMAKDPLALKMLDLCTIPANMGGFPSLSIPCGFAGDLPVGMLLNAPVGADERLLQTAYAIERALPWGYRRPPMP